MSDLVDELEAAYNLAQAARQLEYERALKAEARVAELEAAMDFARHTARGLPGLDLDLEPGRLIVNEYISRADMLAALASEPLR